MTKAKDKRAIFLKTVNEKLDSVSPSMCLAKWTQTTMYLNSGHTHSCHHPGVHAIPNEELETNPGVIHNTPYKQQMRQLMLDGHRPSECDYCWRIEDLNAGHISDRTQKSAQPWSLPHFDEIKTSGVGPDFKPRYVEVLFESTCNYSCAYCMPEISSKWYGEIEQHGPYIFSQGNEHNSNQTNRAKSKIMLAKVDENPFIDAFWKIIPEWWPVLNTFRITGGEPLLSKHTWKMMDFVEENANKNLSFAVNTNLGVPDKQIDQFIARINEIKPNLQEFHVYTSLEATGEQAEYIRYGMEYSKYVTNVKRILEETTAPVTIMTTINALCYSTFKDFVEEFVALRKIYGRRLMFSFNYLRNPDCMDVKYLPQSIKESFASDLQAIIDSPSPDWKSHSLVESYAGADRLSCTEAEIEQIARLLAYMMSEPDADRQAIATKDLQIFMLEMDKRRCLESKKTFPELWTAYESQTT